MIWRILDSKLKTEYAELDMEESDWALNEIALARNNAMF